VSLYAYGAASLLALVILAGTHTKAYLMGGASVRADWDKAIAAANAAAESERVTHQSAIDKLSRQLAQKKAVAQSSTTTLIKEVEIYVPHTLPLLPAGFRVYFDATATGQEIDRSKLDDAAPVAPSDVARTAGINNAIARENADLVTGLQSVIRASGCFEFESEK